MMFLSGRYWYFRTSGDAMAFMVGMEVTGSLLASGYWDCATATAALVTHRLPPIPEYKNASNFTSATLWRLLTRTTAAVNKTVSTRTVMCLHFRLSARHIHFPRHLCVETSNRLQPTLFMFLLKDESDQFRSFWTILRFCSCPIIAKSLHTQVEGLLFYVSN
jgi:hypothetical protein